VIWGRLVVLLGIVAVVPVALAESDSALLAGLTIARGATRVPIPPADLLWLLAIGGLVSAALLSLVATMLVRRRLTRRLRAVSELASRLGADEPSVPTAPDFPTDLIQDADLRGLLEAFAQMRQLLATHQAALAESQETLRQREDQLRQSQKMEALGVMAAGVAHDFNNLLTGIRGFCELLLKEMDSSDPRYRFAQEIARSGDRAAQLARQLLLFSRRHVLQTDVVDLNLVTADMVQLLQRVIGEDIELVTALCPDLGAVKADAGQLQQIILNLAANARDAMPTGGKLKIQTANVRFDDGSRAAGSLGPGDYVMLSITDTGTGIDPQSLPQIFEPFFTTKEAGKGTGLGLATVFGIVKQSGGEILARSALGQGATFEVYLPLVQEALTPHEQVDSPLALPSGSETILLAEDEPGVRALAHTVLAAAGYQVFEACDGIEALTIAAEHAGDIHLLLTDVVMPGMSGRELAERLATCRPESKVLYMSGYKPDVTLNHGVTEEEVAYLQKPFSAVALARQVRMTLDGSSLVDSTALVSST
jgi:two-component system, cell cycle sensor histidine kinase and response regulator CckA